MIISIVLAAKPHLRYWNLSMTSRTSSNAYFDWLPSDFSRFWTPLQGNRTFSRQVQFYCSGAQNFENLLGSLSQPIEPIAAYFWSKNRTQLEMIEDGAYVARSQKSLKVGEKISVEKCKNMVLSKWALIFFFVLLCFVSWKLSREPVEAGFSWKIQVKLENSVYNF